MKKNHRHSCHTTTKHQQGVITTNAKDQQNRRMQCNAIKKKQTDAYLKLRSCKHQSLSKVQKNYVNTTNKQLSIRVRAIKRGVPSCPFLQRTTSTRSSNKNSGAKSHQSQFHFNSIDWMEFIPCYRTLYIHYFCPQDQINITTMFTSLRFLHIPSSKLRFSFGLVCHANHD